MNSQKEKTSKTLEQELQEREEKMMSEGGPVFPNDFDPELPENIEKLDELNEK